MGLWLVRKDLFGQFVGAALCVAEQEAIESSPAQVIVNAIAALNLAEGEHLQPGNNRLWIDKQGNLVGYFDFLESIADPATG